MLKKLDESGKTLFKIGLDEIALLTAIRAGLLKLKIEPSPTDKDPAACAYEFTYTNTGLPEALQISGLIQEWVKTLAASDSKLTTCRRVEALEERLEALTPKSTEWSDEAKAHFAKNDRFLSLTEEERLQEYKK